MINWYIKVSGLTRQMRRKALDVFEALQEGNTELADTVKADLTKDYTALKALWPTEMSVPGKLGQHLHYGQLVDYGDMLRSDITDIEVEAEEYVLSNLTVPPEVAEIGYRHDVFISYSSRDQEQASMLYQAILRIPKTAFLSAKSLIPGDNFAQEIRRQIIASRQIWLLVTPNSLESEWVLAEWGASWVLSKKIVPIFHGLNLQDVPERLRSVQCIEFSEYSKLIRSLA